MAGTVALIDYGSGNLRSAEKALAQAARDGATGHDILVTAEPEQVLAAERLVLPGVGAFADCMHGVASIPGMITALQEKVLGKGAAFLGICVGMQLLAEVGREHGNHKGLGWIAGDVTKLIPADPNVKVPHMGWNALSILQPHAVLEDMADGTDVYFVHSYYIRPKNVDHILATTDYAGSIPAVVGRDNILGTQFHPEKSQAVGLRFLERFLKWRP